jgi:hypothetical protein
MGNVARAIAAAEFTNRVLRDDEDLNAPSNDRVGTAPLLRPLELTNSQSKSPPLSQTI